MFGSCDLEDLELERDFEICGRGRESPCARTPGPEYGVPAGILLHESSESTLRYIHIATAPPHIDTSTGIDWHTSSPAA